MANNPGKISCIIITLLSMGMFILSEHERYKERARADDYKLRYEDLVSEADFLTLLTAAQEYKRQKGGQPHDITLRK